jgi:predicted small secreted protein
MTNALTLLTGILLGLTIVLTYEVRKVNKRQASTMRALELLKDCFAEVIKINESLIKNSKSNAERINELERVI